MYLKQKLHNSRQVHKAWLYSIVFASKISAFTVLFLFLSFFIQPFHRAVANELVIEVSAESSVAEDVRIQIEEPLIVQEEMVSDGVNESYHESEVIDDVEVLSDIDMSELSDDSEDMTLVEKVSVVSEVENDPVDIPSESDSFHEQVISSREVTSSGDVLSATSSNSVISTNDNGNIEDLLTSSSSPQTNDVSTSTSDARILTENTETESVISTGTTSEEVLSENSSSSEFATDRDSSVSEPIEDSYVDPVTDDNSSSSDLTSLDNDSTASDSNQESEMVSNEPDSSGEEEEPKGVNVEEMQYLITEENYYQFSQQSCVAVGDGTYHCTLSVNKTVDTHAVVYSDNDEEGDMEIYIKTSNDKVKKLTDNQLDDTAPYFDADSMRVVWQRLIDGRYQIVSYDLNESEEVQLTFSSANNMEPKVSEEGVVWQAWDNNDWEIMYFDGSYTEQITNNISQDVAPVIEDGYILWSIIGGDSQEAQVYSLESGEIMTISGHNGGAIANPRFVLVYDTKFDNGDIVTKSFDPSTGLSAIIASQPYSEPVKIPPVDTTGEIKALIQNKSSQKEKVNVEGVKHDLITPSDLNVVLSDAATSSLDGVLDLKLGSLNQDMSIISVAEIPPLELTEFDLVIVSTSTTSDGVSIMSTTSEGRASSTQF